VTDAAREDEARALARLEETGAAIVAGVERQVPGWARAQVERLLDAWGHAPADGRVRAEAQSAEAGAAAARRIVAERTRTRFSGLGDLRKIGVLTARAAGFLTLGGRRLQTIRWAEQLGFWRPEEEAGVPQLLYEFSPGTFR